MLEKIGKMIPKIKAKTIFAQNCLHSLKGKGLKKHFLL